MLIKKILPTACTFLEKVDGQVYKKSYETRKMQLDDISYEINKGEPYNFVFTPNGDFATNLNDGDKISLSKALAKSWSCIFIQFHASQTSITKMLGATTNYGLPLPSFGIQDNTYITFFYAFDAPMLRVDLSGFINQAHWDLAPFGANTVMKGVNETFCLPGSFDYSLGVKKEVGIVGFGLNGDILPFEQNLFATIPSTLFQTLWNQYTTRSSYSSSIKKKYNGIQNETQVYQIKMQDILLKDGYEIEDNGINISKDGRPIKTMWYNSHTNGIAVSLLSNEQGGTILEYLHGTREKSHALVNKFFHKEYGFNIIEESSFPAYEEDKDTSISTEKETIVFTKNSIKIQYIKKDGSLAESVIFKQKFKVLGKGKVHFDKSFGGELRNPETVIIIEKDNHIYSLNIITRANKFNDIYNSIGLFCYGSDNMLKVFFQTIIESTDVKEITLIEKSGYYGDACVLGNKVVYGTLPQNHIVTNDSLVVTKEKKQISVKEFYDNMRKIWTEDVAAISLLQTAALHGMNLRQDMKVYPAFRVSAWFKVGKSTLMECCQAFVGYDTTPIAMNSITAQPLSIMGCDNSIIFGEEFTNIKNPSIENIFRNIINRIQGGRGFGTKNVVYNFKANIFAAGESLPQSASLQSRFVSIRLKQTSREKCDNPYIQDMIKQTTCCDELSEFYIKKFHEIMPVYNKKRDMLNKALGDARAADVRAYTFTMREFFPVIDEDKLLIYTKEQIKNMGTDSMQSKSQTPTLKLQRCIMNAHMSRKVILTSVQIPHDDNYQQLNIQFQSDFFAQSKGEIIEIMQEIQAAGYDKMTVDGSLIRIMVPIDATDVSQMEVDLFYMLQYVSNSTQSVKNTFAESFY